MVCAQGDDWGEELRYFPIDEEHPTRPTETYGTPTPHAPSSALFRHHCRRSSELCGEDLRRCLLAAGLSKAVGEEIGRMVARTSDTTVAALRFTNAPELDSHVDGERPRPSLTW